MIVAVKGVHINGIKLLVGIGDGIVAQLGIQRRHGQLDGLVLGQRQLGCMGAVGFVQHVAGPGGFVGQVELAENFVGLAVNLVGQELPGAGRLGGAEADLPDALIAPAQQHLAHIDVILHARVGKGDIPRLLTGQVALAGQQVHGGRVAVEFLVPLLGMGRLGQLLPEGVPGVGFPVPHARAAHAVVVHAVHPADQGLLVIAVHLRVRHELVMGHMPALAVKADNIGCPVQRAGVEGELPVDLVVKLVVAMGEELLHGAVQRGIIQGQVCAVGFAEKLLRQRAGGFGGHVVLAGQREFVVLRPADLPHHVLEEVLFLDCPLVEEAAEGFPAQGHDGFFLPVALAHAQRAHDGGVIIQEDAVFLRHHDDGLQFLVGVLFLGAHFAVVGQGHGDGLLLDQLHAGQQGSGHGGGGQQRQDNRQGDPEFHLLSHRFFLLSVGRAQHLLRQAGIGLQMSALLVNGTNNLFPQKLLIHDALPFPADFSGGCGPWSAGLTPTRAPGPASVQFPGCSCSGSSTGG